MRRRVFLIPGINDSGPAHWQSHWERMYPGVSRIRQADWQSPNCVDWVEAIEAVVAPETVPPILVGHSLGCLAAVHWASRSTSNCFGLLLVAVPDPTNERFPRTALGFAPVPTTNIHSRAVVVGSENDPYASADFGPQLARAWGATYVNEGVAGHINETSGFGDWHHGWALIEKWRYMSV